MVSWNIKMSILALVAMLCMGVASAVVEFDMQLQVRSQQIAEKLFLDVGNNAYYQDPETGLIIVVDILESNIEGVTAVVRLRTADGCELFRKNLSCQWGQGVEIDDLVQRFDFRIALCFLRNVFSLPTDGNDGFSIL